MRNTVTNALLGESYTHIEHPSGLSIYVYPKSGYASSYAVFGAKYGSIDTCFKRSDRDALVRIPEGTAHFLEHKLFESEELDAFEQFAKTGASANAFTSFDRTCYLFSCTGSFKENLEILLGFVRSPYFTAQTVQKEQGIIGQEIDMYKDSPGWQSVFNLLRALYKNHPVNIDIAGTKASIAQITADTLKSCYDTFYNLNNMVLAVAGNVDADEVAAVADRLLTASQDVSVDRVFEEEPEAVVSAYAEEKLSVAIPVFALGFKEKVNDPERSVREEVVKELLLDILAGQTAPLYKELLDGGLINAEFDTEYFNGTNYALTLFSGESTDPKKVAEKIAAETVKLKKEGVSEQDFERARKKLYGRAVMSFNDIEGIANEIAAAHFRGEDVFAEFEALSKLTLDEVNAALKETFDENALALSVVMPK